MTQITPEQALEALKFIDEDVDGFGMPRASTQEGAYHAFKYHGDTIRAALRQASGLDDPWNTQRHICTCACQVAGCDAVKDKAALSQRVGVTEVTVEELMRRITGYGGKEKPNPDSPLMRALSYIPSEFPNGLHIVKEQSDERTEWQGQPEL